MSSLVSKFCKWLFSKPGYRQEVLAELKNTATFEEKKDLTDRLIADDPRLQAHVANSAPVRKQLAADTDFLMESALAPENRKAFFDNSNIQNTAAQLSSIQNRFSKDLRFLVTAALSPDNRKAFFNNGEVKAAIAELTFVRKNLGKDVRFLVASALDEGNRKAFFGNGEVQAAIAETSAIRDMFGNDPRFLVNYSLKDENRKAVLGHSDVQEAVIQLSSTRQAILTSQLNEAEAVSILSGKWPRRERQLSGFSSYLDILARLKPYYDDSPVLKALEDAPLPPEGFPGGAELAEFFTSQLCRDGKFRMRSHKVTYVDRHAIWTLLHEILMDQEYYFETEKKAPFIIDGGANFGMSSIYFKELYPDAEVLAFEPVPFLNELAMKNVADNGLDHVTVLRKGLSSKKGEATFFMSENYSMAGSLTERRKAFGDEVNELTIETVPLADYLDREVDFLKLDIEGAEGAVLMAAGDRIANVRQMSVEWHLNADDSAIALDEVLALLTRNGFRYQIGKSANYARRSRSRPMTHLGEMGTLNFWAARQT